MILSIREEGVSEYLKRTCADYSEEAISERDPAFRDWCEFDTSTSGEHTTDAATPDLRLRLARCLERLGMAPARAAAVAAL